MKISGKNYFLCLLGLVLFLGSIFFIKSAIASEEKITCSNRYVTLVNPVRGRNIWFDKSLKPIKDQYGKVTSKGKATERVLIGKALIAIKTLSDEEQNWIQGNGSPDFLKSLLWKPLMYFRSFFWQPMTLSIDDKHKIIYIGKAKNLKNRVLSYANLNLSMRIEHMVSQINFIEWIITNSEQDALLLESDLIKQFQPKYNILLKDDKTFPFIKINFSKWTEI